MYYREAPDGQMLQEGINEPGALASWIAAATAYSTKAHPDDPFYYSMFGFQRVMDLIWAAGELAGARLPARRDGLLDHAQRRGACSTRTATATSWPPRRCRICVAYDPAYAYELAVILQRRACGGSGRRSRRTSSTTSR